MFGTKKIVENLCIKFVTNIVQISEFYGFRLQNAIYLVSMVGSIGKSQKFDVRHNKSNRNGAIENRVKSVGFWGLCAIGPNKVIYIVNIVSLLGKLQKFDVPHKKTYRKPMH